MLKEEFRTLVQTEMERQRLSQSELGRRMGISQQVISKYLHGQRTPGLDVVEKFFRALGLKPSFTLHRMSSGDAPAT